MPALRYNTFDYMYKREKMRMEAIKNFFEEIFYSIPTIGVMDIIDILIVAVLLYQIVQLIRTTSAWRVVKSIAVLVAVTLLTELMHLYTLNWIFDKILELGAIALVIVFQPELRRALERLGGRSFLRLTGNSVSQSTQQTVISATVSACEVMAKEHIGALIAFERNTSLEEYFKTGTVVDARVTEQILRNIFFPKASLHDGAVIIRGDRVAAAGCVMPLSQNRHLHSDLGTRHRAGVGTSEMSDAVVIVVSEETGTISVATNGMLKRHLAPRTLEKLLTNELVQEDDAVEKTVIGWLKSQMKRVKHDEKQ